MNDWLDDALCREVGPDLFHSETQGDTAVVRSARRVCRACPVAAECLQFALDNNEEFGVWGGTSPRERRRIKRGLPPTRPNRNKYGHGFNCKCFACQRLREAS
jgi:WhiB family redox-sensing transcriptional regulator